LAASVAGEWGVMKMVLLSLLMTTIVLLAYYGAPEPLTRRTQPTRL
jgi:hypothetical protein